MRIIGRGWQYTVYNLGGGRVFKKYNTWMQAYLIMLRDSIRHARFPVLGFSRYYEAGKESAARSLGKITDGTYNMKLFGYPVLHGIYEYEQSYAEPLFYFFKKTDSENGEKMIDRFVEFNRELLSNSLMEKNFNISHNYGLNSSDEIILIDLGEICFEKDEIQKQLQSRVWTAPDVLKGITESLRPYFIEKMDAAFKKPL